MTDHITFNRIDMTDATHRTLQLHFKELSAQIDESCCSAVVLLKDQEPDYKIISELGYAVWKGIPIFVFHPINVIVPAGLAEVASADVVMPEFTLSKASIGAVTEMLMDHFRTCHGEKPPHG